MLRFTLFTLILAATLAAENRTLDIYRVDVQGGGATLIVTPDGHSFLTDTGNPATGTPTASLTPLNKPASGRSTIGSSPITTAIT